MHKIRPAMRCRSVFILMVPVTQGGIDSSADVFGCTWSFAAWIVGDESERLIGHASHSSGPDGTPYFLGEEEESSVCAEMLALGWAYIWALDSGLRFGLPFVFAFDSTSVGLGAMGLQRPPEAGTQSNMTKLAAVVTSLRLCLSSLAPVTARHVKSHSGILGNELVDQLAKAASRMLEDYYHRCWPTWPCGFASHQLHAWAWRLLDSSPDSLTLFALPRSQAAGMPLYGKKDILKSQLEECEAHVVGLQETRLAGDQEAADADYWISQASCEPTGCFGVAVWIHKRRPFLLLNGKPVRVQREQLTVVKASPRASIVDVSTPVFRFVIVTTHAPHDVRPGDPGAAKAFWGEVERSLCAFLPQVPFLFLTDANAHRGSVQSDAIGSLAPEAEN